MQTEGVLDDKREAEARAKEEYIRPEPKEYDEGLLELFSDLINERSFNSDEEIMRQWELFKREKDADDLKRKIKEALKRETIPSKSEKLWNDYLKVAPADITYKLVELIGSVSQGKTLTSKRIRKFIEEVLPKSKSSEEEKEEVKNKLLEIADAMDTEEGSDARRRVEVKTSRTGTALQAESEGNAIGKMSRTTSKGIVTIKWDRGRQNELRCTSSQSNELLIPKFRKIDLLDENWFNAGAGTLLPIVEAHLKLVDSSLNKWKNANNDAKAEIAKKLNRLRNTPDYIKPSSILAILYDRVWVRAGQQDVVEYENPPLDFGYWVKGIVEGIAGVQPRQGVGFVKDLLRLESKILPSLIKAIKEGVVVDPDEGTVSVVGIQRKYNRAIKRLTNERNRNDAITTMFKIMNGESISDDFKGKDKKLLADIESSIRNQASEKVHGKSMFYLLLEAHMEFSKLGRGRNILVNLLQDKRPSKKEDEVKFVERSTPQQIKEPNLKRKDKGGVGITVYLDEDGKELTFVDEDGQPRIPDKEEYDRKEVRQPKKKLVPLQEKKWNDEGSEYEMVDVLDDDGKKIMVEPKESLPKPKAGEKSLEWARKRRENLREETKEVREIVRRDEEGKAIYGTKTVPKYTEEEIDELTGFTSSGARAKFKTDEYGRKVRKSLEELLDYIGETDDVIYKEDTGLILESLNKTQKKKLKTILNVADPTEYFGHDFLKLADVIKVLKSLGVVKGDKQLGKKVIKLEDKNLKVVKLATKLRKDYERLYDELRKLIFPKAGVDEK
jgi:hypothetical protein